MKNNLLLIILFLSFCVYSQEINIDKTNFSLSDAQLYALEYSKEVQNAEIDIIIARKKIWETTAIGLPQLNGKVEYQNMLKIPTQLIPDFTGQSNEKMPVQFGTKHNASWGVTLSQLVFSGEYIVGLQAAKVYKELSEKQAVKTEFQIYENIANSYFTVLIAKENLKILQELFVNVEKLYYETVEINKVGLIEDTDVDQVLLSKTNLKNSINSVERQIDLANKLLKLQMGIDINKDIKLTNDLNSIISDVNVNKLFYSVFDNVDNIDFQLMLTQEKMSELSLKREKSTFLPSLSAFYSYKKNSMNDKFKFSNGSTWYPTEIIGLTLNVPIFGSGQKIAKVQQRKLELIKIQNQKEQFSNAISLEYQQALSNLKNSKESHDNQEKSLELAKKIYDKTLLKYKEGMATSMELNQAQNQYLENQTTLFNTLLEMFANKNKLERIIRNYKI